MKCVRIRKGVIAGNAFRICKGLGLIIPLLLAGPAALAKLDLGPAADLNGNLQGTATPLKFVGRNWRVNGTYTRVPDSDLFDIARRPAIIRQLPLPREENAIDIPFVPEPSSVIAASLLLLPLGASALRLVRKRKAGNMQMDADGRR